MSIRFRLVSQLKNKLNSNSEQSIHAVYLSPITFGVNLPPKLRGENSTNSQTYPGTTDENKSSKVCMIKI